MQGVVRYRAGIQGGSAVVHRAGDHRNACRQAELFGHQRAQRAEYLAAAHQFRQLLALKAGQAVQLNVDALPGKTFEGRIDRVSPVVDSGSGTFRVICAFDGGGLLQPGMFGRIRIEYDQRANALVIPRTALLEDGNAPAVFTVKADKAARTALKLGYVDGEWVEVREGLRDGDAVVVAGKATLREGSAVQVIGGKPVAAAATVAQAAAK